MYNYIERTKKIILVVSLLSTILIIVEGRLIQIASIPFIFGIMFFLLIPKKIILGSGLTMMMIVSILRYIVYPVLLQSELIQAPFFTSLLLNRAIFFMIIEMLAIFITIKFYYRGKGINNIWGCNLKLKKISPFLPFVLFIYIVIIFAIFPSVFANKHFILDTAEIASEQVELAGYLTVPIKWAESFIIVYLFTVFYFKYKTNKMKLYYYASLFVILFPCMFFSGHSRLSLLMPLVCAVFMLIKLYADKAKRSVYIVAIYGFFALLFLSMYKFYGGASLNVASENISVNETTLLFNAYFGGIKNIMVGLQAYDIHGSNIEVFFNDIFRNAMGISRYFENGVNSVSMFNGSFYGSLSDSEDQICPTIIEGLFCFGPYLCFLPTILMVYAVLYFDYKWMTERSLEFSYVFATSSSLIGFCVPGNLMHLSSNVINYVLPMILLIFINRRFIKY